MSPDENKGHKAETVHIQPGQHQAGESPAHAASRYAKGWRRGRCQRARAPECGRAETAALAAGRPRPAARLVSCHS